MDVLIDACMDLLMDVWFYDGWIDILIDRLIYCWMDGFIYGLMDLLMDGWSS